MGHWGHTEWVRGSSKTRHVIAVFSHIQLHDTECNRKVYLAWNVSVITRVALPWAGRGQVLLRW